MTNKESRRFETMFAYARDADVSGYEVLGGDRGESFFEAFKPCYDPNFMVDYSDSVVVAGIRYVKVNWGESYDSYLREDAVRDDVYARYIHSKNGWSGRYVADGRVYDAPTPTTDEEEDEN